MFSNVLSDLLEFGSTHASTGTDVTICRRQSVPPTWIERSPAGIEDGPISSSSSSSFWTTTQISSDHHGTSPSYSFIPVSIKTLESSFSKEDVKIKDDVAVTRLAIVVGIVKTVKLVKGDIFYTIEDLTGFITAVQRNGATTFSTREIQPNTYCKIYGGWESEASCFCIYSIVPIENMMEVTHHYLRVMYVPLKLNQLSNSQSSSNVSSSETPAVTMVNSPRSFFNHLSKLQREVCIILQQRSRCNEIGLNCTAIQSAMSVQHPSDDINKALDFLLNEGHVYNTIDDYHFKSIYL